MLSCQNQRAYSNPPPRAFVDFLILKKATQALNGPALLFCVEMLLPVIVMYVLNLFCMFFCFGPNTGTCIVFSIDLLYFLKYLSEYFLFICHIHALLSLFCWMKHVSLIKARWFHMPRLNFFSNILFCLTAIPVEERGAS